MGQRCYLEKLMSIQYETSLASRLNQDQLDINQITPERWANRVF